MSFIAELRRRNVFRVAAAYGIVGWLLVEVASVVLPTFEAPAWVMKVFTFLVILGFPLALILAWAFELTPEGIKRESSADPGESASSPAGRKLDIAIIALLAIAVVYFAVDKFALRSEPGPRPVAEEPAPAPEPDTAAAIEREKSIAVLPFDNISPDPEDAYFADGIHDEVLAQLSKIRDLKVISRTSVMRYRSQTRPSLPEIASALGAANILEGSVRLAGSQVRITTQLIDAESDAHLWTETYDRELTAANIFSIQSEIARTVANALRTTLSTEERDRLAAVPTENLAAYQAYLLGNQRLMTLDTVAVAEAVEFFQQAIELDPGFALAYVGLATSYYSQIDFGGLSPAEMLAKAEPLIEKALELDDRSGEAHAVLGNIHWDRAELEEAETSYRRALELSPSHADAYDHYGALLRMALGRPEEALGLHKRAVELNPLSTYSIFQIWQDLTALGRYDEAWSWLEKSLAIDPGSALTLDTIGIHSWRFLADLAEAVRWLRQAVSADPGDTWVPAHLGVLFMDLGDPERAEYWVRRSIALGPESWIANRTMQLLQLNLSDEAAALEYGRRAAAIGRVSEILSPSQFIADQQLRASRYAEARAVYEENRPELLGGDAPIVAYQNTRVAIDLAAVLFRTGEEERAQLLLERALERVQEVPRLTGVGFPVSDVKIFALQGEKKKALAALRSAIDEGWRRLWWYSLRLDPGLESLHDEPEFQAMVAEIEADMAAQLERVREMEANGELVPIPDIPTAAP